MAKDFAKAFYNSTAWQNTRQWVLHRDGMICRECAKRGLVVPAAEVHHIIHLTAENINDKRITLNPDNLVSLCYECHKKEHEQDRAKGMLQNQRATFEVDYTFDDKGNIIPRGV